MTFQPIYIYICSLMLSRTLHRSFRTRKPILRWLGLYIHTYRILLTNIYIYICIYIYMYSHIYICLYIMMGLFSYLCMYICVYIYTYLYIDMLFWQTWFYKWCVVSISSAMDLGIFIQDVSPIKLRNVFFVYTNL